ncbi:MAG TPA: M14 family zinc carboxypeptidase [Woeseiaceae bacterium]|nr:M14 family zinc carboxypeptidase [Woeseiaceae bacterium]
MMARYCFVLLLPALIPALFLSAPATAQQTAVESSSYAPDTPEPGSVEAIAGYTTGPQYINPWVAYVPESQNVPSPTDYLGHVVGAAGELSRTSQIYGYFRALAAASERVDVSVIGRTEEGREILLIAIADEQGLRDLPKLTAATAALADPRKTTPEQAEAIITAARPVYYLNAGLHSTETGSPEMVMELAYRLAVSEQPMIRRIRDSLVVLINPVSEPDGRDKAVDWFYRYLKGKTDFDALPPRSPPYWGHYVFHDNNRDTHQKALQITRAVHRMFYEYHPTVVHDLHESIPLLMTWNGTGPMNENVDPILIDEWFEMSFAEIRTMTTLGMPGVWTWAFGEGWGHHYLDSVAVNHNSIGRGYETFGNATAETVDRVLRSNQDDAAGKPVTSAQWYRPWPPERNIRWSLRNNTNYMQTGVLAILDYSAKNAADMLRGFYRKGYNSWQKGITEKPYGFVIPADQGDPRRVAEMVGILTGHKIEVGRARAAFSLDEGRFPAGTFVVRLDQPYRNYAVDLLTPQEFPSDTEFTPYDDVSWALPAHYGLEARATEDAGIRDVAVDPVPEGYLPSAKVSSSGPVFLLADSGQESLLAARARLARFRIDIAEQAFKSGGEDYPSGSWILPAQDGLQDALDDVAAEFALVFRGVRREPDVRRHASPLPRVAVWHTWEDTESVGWIRYSLDQRNIPYAHIRDDDIRAGALRERYDIILFGNHYGDLQEQIHGIDKSFGPMPYTRTEEYPSHGVPDASDDITGGIGWTGMAKLEEFLDAGGMLITLGNGSALALEGGLARGVSATGNDAVTPGSELQTTIVRPEHPIAYGYAARTSAFRSSYTVYNVRRAQRDQVVMQWGSKPMKDDRDEEAEKEEKENEDEESDAGELVISGGIKNGDSLQGHPAILDIPVGTGRVIAFNFNPMHRDLNRSDHRFLWNAILNWQWILQLAPAKDE